MRKSCLNRELVPLKLDLLTFVLPRYIPDTINWLTTENHNKCSVCPGENYPWSSFNLISPIENFGAYRDAKYFIFLKLLNHLKHLYKDKK